MKHFFISFLLLLVSTGTFAQVHVCNKGLLAVNGNNIHLEGNFLNDTTSAFLNNGSITVKGNITNHQQIFTPSTGALLLKGNSRQVIRGSQTFSTFNISVENSNGVLLENNLLIWNDAAILSGILDADTFRITLGGNISSVNGLNISTGELELNGSIPQNIPANTFRRNLLGKLVINNDVKFNGPDTITNSITFAGSGYDLQTGGELVLKSDSNRTARIGDLTGGGLFSNNSITGHISVERFISARKAWRLLSAPLQTNDAPTINASWQEGATSGNPVPGYGVHITGGNIANGFDQSATNLASIKVYDNATASFKALPAVPGTNITITSYNGYFLYIRGNRSINLMQGAAAAVTATTLRMKGYVNTGNQVVNVNASGYTVAGNPYASAIDFKSLSRTNVRNAFYVWDPALSGAYGLGAYVTFSWNSSTGEYDKTSSASPVSQYIPSGEAFIVQSNDGQHPGSLLIRETDKTIKGSDDVFGRSNGLDQRIRVDLISSSDNALLDGVLSTFDVENNNEIDNNDALKLHGTAENVSINREGHIVSIERRAEPQLTDTIPYTFHRLRNQEYRLRIEAKNMNMPGLAPFLVDAYSAAGNLMLDPNGITEYVFTVNTDPASFHNRFKIVFNRLTALPLTITSIKASRQNEVVLVTWTTENESVISHYDIERSADGTTFNKVGTKSSLQENTNTYTFPDTDPLSTECFYRIKSFSQDNTFDYSSMVKINAIVLADNIVISPNPVTGNIIKLKVNNIQAGAYQLRIFNDLGQQIEKRTIYYNGRAEFLTVPVNIPKGVYSLQFMGYNVDLKTRLLMN